MNLVKRLVKGLALTADEHDYNLSSIEAEFTTVLKKGGYVGTAKDLKDEIEVLKGILDSDDATLDELQEVVNFIKQNKDDLQNLSVENIAGLVSALAGKVDKEIGKGLSTNDFTNELQQKVNNSLQKNAAGSELRFFNEKGDAVAVPTSTYATTIFIDKNIVDSSDSVLDQRSKPFKTMLDGKNALTGFESAIRYHFISNGDHEGCELDQIDTEFNADSKATIDFTNVNVGGSIISNENDPDFNPTFLFVGGRVSIVSNMDNTLTGHTHSFTPMWAVHTSEVGKYKVYIKGHIDTFDWRAAAEDTGSINTDSHILASGTTSLIVNKFICIDDQTSNKILSFDDYSEVTFRNVTHISGSKSFISAYHGSINLGIQININSLYIYSGLLRIYLKTSFKNIKGTGTLNCPSIIFDDCFVEETIDMNFVGISYLSGRITSDTPVRSSYTISPLTIENFKGHIQFITLNSINANCGIQFFGTNEILVKSGNRLASVNGIQDAHLLEVIQVRTGVTVIEAEDPAAILFTGGGANKKLQVRSTLHTNCQNIGITVEYKNNELRTYP